MDRVQCIPSQRTVVVVGFSMTGLKLVENIRSYDSQVSIVAFSKEPHLPYDRVNLTKYFGTRESESLMLKDSSWYAESGITVYLGDAVSEIDSKEKMVTSSKGVKVHYDELVFATGSVAFIPSLKGPCPLVYRSIADAKLLISKLSDVKSACVIGGGLLGLEAAKVCLDLGVKDVCIVDRGKFLMSRQLDAAASKLLTVKILGLGISVYNGSCITEFDEVSGTAIVRSRSNVETQIAAEVLVAAAGIRPNDSLARTVSGLRVHEKGGIEVDDAMATTAKCIYAVGEVALHRGTVYGLVNPCYEQAKVVAYNLTHEDKRVFESGDLSAKLKLLGVDVACFGEYRMQELQGVARCVTYTDPFEEVYRKLIFNWEGDKLLGGILVGAADDYSRLAMKAKAGTKLKVSPSTLTAPRTVDSFEEELDDGEQVCSCNDVLVGKVRCAVRDGCSSVSSISDTTNAGTGCGGCKPLILQLLTSELKRLGKKVDNSLCSHFPLSRQSLYHIVKVKQLKSFRRVMREVGKGSGCEVCKPVVASILASLWNEHILEGDRAPIQDTNDRFLANLQRGGSYSVVPRVPGGEITPAKLQVLGKVAEDYGLYTKITGGQRIDLFGAKKHELPEIWEVLTDAGFESGHAYGKALRTVKSCVGSSWCRFGMRDSVGLAVMLENRYKGIRSPHKIKGGVSGCIRECAEAKGKDFGLIAVEGGYNLYVCGNGGSKPKHGQLLAAGINEKDCVKYLDRFLSFYIRTAERLQRTARWLEALEGGIDYLRKVVVDDSLGLADDFESHIASLVAQYKCEWRVVVDSPEKRRAFRQFANTDLNQQEIGELIERGQKRPVDWPCSDLTKAQSGEMSERSWVKVGSATGVPEDGGLTFLYGASQLAIFNFKSKGGWYATQNMCPHKNAFVLSQGMLSEVDGKPMVACPMHKRKYVINEDGPLYTFSVEERGGELYVELPAKSVMEKLLGDEGAHRLW